MVSGRSAGSPPCTRRFAARNHWQTSSNSALPAGGLVVGRRGLERVERPADGG
jgi:hypothetical protein